MALPTSAISSLRATFSPYSPLAKPCRLFLSLLQKPTTTPAASAKHISITVKRLPRDTKQLPEMTIGFKNGKELKLEVGKLRMSVADVIEEVGREGRVIEREASLKG